MPDAVHLALVIGGFILVAISITAGAVLISQWIKQHSVAEQGAAKAEPTTKAGMGSCIGSGMSIAGNIECSGPAQVFGRIEGELRAFGSPDRRWRTGRGQRHCPGRYSLRPREGHHPCRARQAPGRWCCRWRHFSSVVVDRRELFV